MVGPGGRDGPNRLDRADAPVRTGRQTDPNRRSSLPRPSTFPPPPGTRPPPRDGPFSSRPRRLRVGLQSRPEPLTRPSQASGAPCPSPSSSSQTPPPLVASAPSPQAISIQSLSVQLRVTEVYGDGGGGAVDGGKNKEVGGLKSVYNTCMSG